jgi:hexulose-6-phosphate isomerase
VDRREFLKNAAKGAISVSIIGAITRKLQAKAIAKKTTSAPKKKSELKKAFCFSMFPDSLSVEDRFKLAQDIGLDGVEVKPTLDAKEIADMLAASEKTGVEIHSIIYGGWNAPLSSPDPAVAEKGAKEVADALKSANELGAENILLVPAVVNENTRYVDAYERSQAHLRKLAAEAEKQRIMILVENVWNNFLLSPIEFARYVDEIGSPWVQAYFDVGNVLAFGWPEDWIRTLGNRIKKVHLKDFKRGTQQFVNLLEGDVNWPEVRKALHEVGYRGYLTAELGGGDTKYLRDVSERIDKIINS